MQVIEKQPQLLPSTTDVLNRSFALPCSTSFSHIWVPFSFRLVLLESWSHLLDYRKTSVSRVRVPSLRGRTSTGNDTSLSCCAANVLCSSFVKVLDDLSLTFSSFLFSRAATKTKIETTWRNKLHIPRNNFKSAIFRESYSVFNCVCGEITLH